MERLTTIRTTGPLVRTTSATFDDSPCKLDYFGSPSNTGSRRTTLAGRTTVETGGFGALRESVARFSAPRDFGSVHLLFAETFCRFNARQTERTQTPNLGRSQSPRESPHHVHLPKLVGRADQRLADRGGNNGWLSHGSWVPIKRNDTLTLASNRTSLH